MNHQAISERVADLSRQHDLARRARRAEKAFLAEAKLHLQAALEARQVLQAVAEALQQTAHEQVERIVSRCLRAVWGKDAYRFAIHFERKRGKTEARLTFRRKGLVLEEPRDEASGGMIGLAAFALRLAKLRLTGGGGRQLLLLDEPFPGIQRSKAARVRRLLEALAGELGFQIIMTTHNKSLAAGKVIELGRDET